MIERIGTTRSGKPIDLVWHFENGGRKVLSVSAFVDLHDRYDVFVTLEVKWWEALWSAEAKLSKTEATYRELLMDQEFDLGSEEIERLGLQLGLHTSIERMGFGRTELLFPRMTRKS